MKEELSQYQMSKFKRRIKLKTPMAKILFIYSSLQIDGIDCQILF